MSISLTVDKGKNGLLKYGGSGSSITIKGWDTDSWGSSSHVIGCETGSDRFRIERYKIEIPDTDESGKKITKLTELKIVFSSKGDFARYNSSSMSLNEGETFKCLLSSNSNIIFNPITDYNLTEGQQGPGTAYPFAGVSVDGVTINLSSPKDFQNQELMPGSTYYLYIYINVAKYYWRYWNSGKAPTITAEYLSYTKCLPVENFNPFKDKPYISPLQKNTVLTWVASNEALSGIENKAIGFNLYYGLSANELSQINENTITDNFFIWQVPEGLTRGTEYTIAIETVGEQRGYNSEYALSTFTVNTQPTISYASLTSNYIGMEVYQETTFELFGSDIDNQSIYFYYSFTRDGDKTQCVNNAIDLSSKSGDTSIYFWAYDGLEYSETYKQVDVFALSRVESFQETSMELKDHVLKVSFSGITSNSRNLPQAKLTINYGNTKTQKFSPFWLNYDNSYSCTLEKDIYELFSSAVSSNIDYTLSISFIKEYGDSKKIEYGPYDLGGSTFQAISNFPSKFSSEIHCDLSGRRINRVEVSNDSNFIASSVYDNAEGKLTIYTNNNGEGTATFDIIGYCSGGTTYKGSLKATQVKYPRISKFTPEFGGITKIEAFETNSNTVQLSISTEAAGYDQATLVINGNLENQLPLTDYQGSGSNNQIYSVSLESVRKQMFSVYNVDEQNNSKDANVQLCLTKRNVDQSIYCPQYSKPFTLRVNFIKNPQNINISKIVAYEGDALLLQEGLTPKLTISASLYSRQTTYFKLINNGKQIGPIKSLPYSNEIEYVDNTLTGQASLTLTFDELGEIDFKSSNWKVAASVDQVNWVESENEFNKEVVRHTSPKLIITNAEVIELGGEKKIEVELNQDLSDWGHDNLASSSISIEHTNTLICNSEEITNKTKSLVYSLPNVAGSVFKIQINYTSVIKQGDNEQQKSGSSNVYIIYDEAPTVAYRPNCIGINTSNPEGITTENGKPVIVISSASGKELILLKGSSSQAFINLEEMTITGLSIDCGSWDSITS